jgi:hypothetical protein
LKNDEGAHIVMFVGQRAVSPKVNEVNIMAFILSLYATVLTLAIWQEAQSDNDMHNANKA